MIYCAIKVGYVHQDKECWLCPFYFAIADTCIYPEVMLDGDDDYEY